jgi:hypothetical protein
MWTLAQLDARPEILRQAVVWREAHARRSPRSRGWGSRALYPAR